MQPLTCIKGLFGVNKGKVASNIFLYISFVLSGAFFLLFQFLIIKFWNFEVLGVFNKVYIIFIILSQIIIFGIHLSIQRYVADINFITERNDLFITALIVQLLIAILVVISFFLMSDAFNLEGLSTAILALPFLSLNKSFHSFYIALNEHLLYGLQLMIRSAIMLLYVIVAFFFVFELYNCFIVAEITLFLINIIWYTKKNVLLFGTFRKKWITNHFQFGIYSFWGNLFLDLNAKVDVLVLSVFLSNHQVGIYSFVAGIYEAFGQIIFLVRNRLSPVISRVFFTKRKILFERFVTGVVDDGFKYLGSLSLAIVFVFPLFLLLFGFSHVIEQTLLLGILLLGSTWWIGYSLVLLVFNQTGLPEIQSKLIVISFFVNLCLNFILIPVLGMYGAAIATTVTNIVFTISIKRNIKQSFGF